MLHKFSALLVLAVSVFAAEAARADWYMVSGQDFHPYSKTTDYQCSGGRGCYVAGGFTSVMASVRIPIGRSFKSLYCQVLDISATQDVSFSLTELQSSDSGSSPAFSNRTMMSLSSSGAPGHVKIATTIISGSAVAKDYECLTSSCTYYRYYLFVTLPGTSNTNVKSCAIEYQ